MTAPSSPIRTPLLAPIAASLLAALAGCQAIDFYENEAVHPVSPELVPPRELSMVSLPTYRIEPPDLIQIEMLKQVPLPPYRAKIYDVLEIHVARALPDQPIANYYLVDGEGRVNLGPTYGSLWVAGMTVEEIKTTLTEHLSQILADPGVSVQLARASGMQPVSGEYLLQMDGTVNLRQYGSVNLTGKTVAEAETVLEKHLAEYFDSPEVTVNVIAYNSKVYYIVTEGANLGDNLIRVPVTGKETVLDALSQVGGLSQLSSENIWIARPAPGDFGCEQILPVDYDAITRGAVTATNYQILPGDRIFIAEDNVMALTNFINKMVAPLERAAGITSLTTSTIRNLQTLGRNFARNRRQ